eukprot:GHRQ01039578.1.p1 GENE.GHRQ01039578.1~~GHRQ01039578.1.p1  ORF type:complete len:150 (+),score=18.32 GHRQ01039578.1:150-599(+)
MYVWMHKATTAQQPHTSKHGPRLEFMQHQAVIHGNARQLAPATSVLHQNRGALQSNAASIFNKSRLICTCGTTLLKLSNLQYLSLTPNKTAQTKSHTHRPSYAFRIVFLVLRYSGHCFCSANSKQDLAKPRMDSSVLYMPMATPAPSKA